MSDRVTRVQLEDRPRRARFNLAAMLAAIAVVCIAAPIPTFGQTLGANLVTFVPSADHDGVAIDGQPLVSKYFLEIYGSGASTPQLVIDLGKPAPGADGYIAVPIDTGAIDTDLWLATLEARVRASGPYGTVRSATSNPFTFDGCQYVLPGAMAVGGLGGSTTIAVKASSECSWAARPVDAWLSVDTDSWAQGSGEVAITVGPNSTATARVGTVAVGPHLLLVFQEGGEISVPDTVPAPPVNMPPSITITSPINGTRLLGSSSVVTTVDVSDVDGSVARVELFLDGRAIGSTTQAPFSIVWNGPSSGTHTIAARAVDDGGATTMSPSITVSFRKRQSR